MQSHDLARDLSPGRLATQMALHYLASITPSPVAFLGPVAPKSGGNAGFGSPPQALDPSLETNLDCAGSEEPHSGVQRRASWTLNLAHVV